MTLAVPQRAKREVKKTEKRGGSNKCQEWKEQDNNKALETKGTDANNIKIILKISPNLNFFPLICPVC